jgi:hypothetical protein
MERLWIELGGETLHPLLFHYAPPRAERLANQKALQVPDGHAEVLLDFRTCRSERGSTRSSLT